ncbi:ribosomal protein L37AE/L43A [Oikeobacillus pervagus]|uniref:Ribosomal protein L37AE/L43A n=1 Tax=Oikeobacillus pervagus TaxID=1325931 RepID=A0AAJ1WHI4_9BACI|nr:nuclease-related domain-containing protein [Oikeobacillus pervagus]MDQ0216227.1 ribosomal protein L37AE/L43A [Oikeobacillus pervagus]
MIVKEREFPLYIQKLQALKRRLSTDHPKIPEIEEKLAKHLAGFHGENAIDYPLSLFSEEYLILHDLRLPHKKHFFQIDTLLLSKCVIVILEVKNFAGKLLFDPLFHQLIQMKDGQEKALPDPLSQVNRLKLQLEHWLSIKKFPKVPIFPLVVISNVYSQIQTTSMNEQLHKKVIHKDYLPIKLQQIKRIFQKEQLYEKEMKKIVRLLKKDHTSADFSVLNHFQLKKEQILNGVFCPICTHLPMIRNFGTWYCSRCRHTCKDAHKSALRDYYLLLGSTLTNKEARSFLQIASSSVTSRLLRSMDFSFKGEGKGRVYMLSLKKL